jgi:hypothetical protein
MACHPFLDIEHIELRVVPFGHGRAQRNPRPDDRAFSGGRFGSGEYHPIMFLAGCPMAESNLVGCSLLESLRGHDVVLSLL